MKSKTALLFMTAVVVYTSILTPTRLAYSGSITEETGRSLVPQREHGVDPLEAWASVPPTYDLGGGPVEPERTFLVGPLVPDGELAGNLLEKSRGGISVLQILGLIVTAYDNSYAVMLSEQVRRQWTIRNDRGEDEVVDSQAWKLTFANGEPKFVLVLTDGTRREYPVGSLYNEEDLRYLSRYILNRLEGAENSESADSGLSDNLKKMSERLAKIDDPVQLRIFFKYITDELSSASLGVVRIKAGTEPGQELILTIRGEKWTFRWCPPGEFTRTASAETVEYVTSRDRYGRTVRRQVKKSGPEESQRVILTRGFWILDSEVTNQTYYRVMFPSIDDLPSGQRLPESAIHWDIADNFCKRLQAITFHTFTLPTEAQWEYACRAGTEENAADLNAAAWYRGNSRYTTHDVKTKQPNAWGIYDMLGNASEWCSDWYGEDYYRTSAVVEDPEGPSKGEFRVVRGGNCQNGAEECRPGYRSWKIPEFRNDPEYWQESSVFLGFRVILIPDAEKKEGAAE